MNTTQQNQSQKPAGGEGPRKNNVLIAIGIVILVIVLALIAGKKKTAAPTTDETTTLPGEETTLESADTDTNDSSYQDALEAYIGQSIQFSAANGTCAGFPLTQAFKKGSRVLLDNHGTESLTIVFGEKTVTLKPFHYATLPLSETGTFAVTCNGVASAASVTVIE